MKVNKPVESLVLTPQVESPRTHAVITCDDGRNERFVRYKSSDGSSPPLWLQACRVEPSRAEQDEAWPMTQQTTRRRD